MFMRTGFVVGEAGLLKAVIILLIAKVITTLTTFSISAVATNMRVRGGGAYFLISRVLGPEFGGAIGMALFLAQAVSVPFYVLGFSEALVRTLPATAPYFQWITLGSAAVLFVVAYVGASWAIKAQLGIMIVLGTSIVSFMVGLGQRFGLDTLTTNMDTHYTVIGGGATGPAHNFWSIFAIYFPAVTGILAGVNMSGDLKDPGKSIPKGTFAAIGVGFLVYLSQMVMMAGAAPASELIAEPYEVLVRSAFLGGVAVAVGVCAASLSSALGSYLGAPRILQAVARDGMLAFVRPFAAGSAKGDEPRRALVLTGLITLGVLLWAGNESEGGPLNAVAALITMFFLYTYGMTNLAAALEGISGNPSFRPRFRYFHWSLALLGAIGCIGAAFLIDWKAATYSMFIIAGMLWYVRSRQLSVSFRDARRGFHFAAVRRALFRLAATEEDAKNWRPTILVLSGNPATREGLVQYASWLEGGRGIVLLANVLIGDLEDRRRHRDAAVAKLNEFCMERNMQAFPMVVVADTLEQGVRMVVQTATVGSIHANLAALGWAPDPAQAQGLLHNARLATRVGMSVVLLHTPQGPALPTRRRIDVWWRGLHNGALMLLLAYLVSQNREWTGATIRIMRVVGSEDARHEAEQRLRELVDQARVQASVRVIVTGQPFREVVREHSADAGCFVLGFDLAPESAAESWHRNYADLLEGMPAAVLVHSIGREDINA
jgi:amino acid transporter